MAPDSVLNRCPQALYYSALNVVVHHYKNVRHELRIFPPSVQFDVLFKVSGRASSSPQPPRLAAPSPSSSRSPRATTAAVSPGFLLHIRSICRGFPALINGGHVQIAKWIHRLTAMQIMIPWRLHIALWTLVSQMVMADSLPTFQPSVPICPAARGSLQPSSNKCAIKYFPKAHFTSSILVC